MLLELSVFSFFIPLLTGLITFNRLPSILKLTLLVVLINGTVDAAGYYIYKSGLNTSVLLNLYIVPFLIIWTLPIYKSMNRSSYRILISVVFFITAITSVLLLALESNNNELVGYSLSVTGLGLIIINLIYIYHTAVISDKLSFELHPIFFISCSILLYQTFNTLVLTLINQLDAQALSVLWNFKYLSYILLNLVIGFVFAYYGRKRT